MKEVILILIFNIYKVVFLGKHYFEFRVSFEVNCLN